MATTTTNYNLKKPAETDFYDIADNNENMDILDTNLKRVDDAAAGHIAKKDNPHSVTKAQVGLGNVDNTSDANKPISTATQTALNGKSNTNHNHAGVYQPVGEYLTAETDPTVPAWAKAASKPAYTAAEVGADPAGSAAGVQSNLDTHTGNKVNPHGVTAAQVGAAPAYTYGTADMTAGTSPLETGKLYFMYE